MLFISQRKQLLGISLDVMRFAYWKSQWGGAENVGNKLELLAVPCIKIRAGTGRQRQFVEDQQIGLHWQIDQGGCEIEPMDLEHVEFFVTARADLHWKVLHGTNRSPAAEG